MPDKFPNDWFDLSTAQYGDLGTMFYLAALTTNHRGRTLGQVLYAFETPFRLGQYHIFRQNGFPRGFVTFAGLTPEAEHRYAVLNEPLTDRDFAAGPSFWIVDLVAPFGQIRQMVDILKREVPHPRVRTNRMDRDLTKQRIVEWTRDGAQQVHMRLYRKREFEKQLQMQQG